jgi:hypothetical protein
MLGMTSQIAVRVFLEEQDVASIAAFAQLFREHFSPFGNILRLETKAYWKIPNWTEIFLTLQPFATIEAAPAFNRILSSLGEGWEKHGAEDEETQWAVWNPKPGCTFRWQLVRWANVELFPEPRTD